MNMNEWIWMNLNEFEWTLARTSLWNRCVVIFVVVQHFVTSRFKAVSARLVCFRPSFWSSTALGSCARKTSSLNSFFVNVNVFKNKEPLAMFASARLRASNLLDGCPPLRGLNFSGWASCMYTFEALDQLIAEVLHKSNITKFQWPTYLGVIMRGSLVKSPCPPRFVKAFLVHSEGCQQIR